MSSLDPSAPAIPSRRTLLLALAASQLFATSSRAADARYRGPDQVGKPLTPWLPGSLEIHHIATGRGNSTFVRMPDGTSLLIDAGATLDRLELSAAPMPDGSRRPGEWIERYVRRRLGPGKDVGLDYALMTHLHPDHLGDVGDGLPTSKRGAYRLTGISDAAETLPIGTLIDRGFPNYDYPTSQRPAYLQNYLAYVNERVKAGGRVESIQVGSYRQIGALYKRRESTEFSVRNVAGNGMIWTGVGDGSASTFPELRSLSKDDYPNENMCSIAVRISHGKIGYFTGGDLTSYTYDGVSPWRDILTAACKSAGHVDVATADHHGLWDGISGDSVRALSPQVWVVPSWHISHPDMLQLERMFSERLYAGPRDVFSTSVMPANQLINRRLISKLRSINGHVIVRGSPDGNSFEVVVTDNAEERDTVRLISDPYLGSSGNK